MYRQNKIQLLSGACPGARRYMRFSFQAFPVSSVNSSLLQTHSPCMYIRFSDLPVKELDLLLTFRELRLQLSQGMYRTFIKIALRFFRRNRKYTLLNYLGLTFGLTCSIIALLYILNITGYDRFHRNYDRLYEVESIVTFFNGDRFSKEPQSASLTELLARNAPEIESMTRITVLRCAVVNGERSFDENGIYADQSFFDLFSFPFLSGTPSGALSDINSIVISERLAIKVFGEVDCLGKTLILKDDNNEKAFSVTGVLRNVPLQSSLRFDFILPFSRFLAGNGWVNETGASATAIWALTRENIKRAAVNDKIKDLIRNQESTLNQELFLFPLKEKTLYAYTGERRVWRGMQTLVLVGSIGLAILLIACFNFINLAIGMNIRRYREVGVRKVFGAARPAIVAQFLGETGILVLASLFSAIILSLLLINGFNTLFNGDIHLHITDYKVLTAIAATGLFTASLSGSLPAIYLSSANPVTILRARIISGHSFSFLRQSLIVLQFAIPVVLMICMMIIRVQDKYVRDFDIGIDRDRLIILGNTKNLQQHEESFRADLLTVPGIDAVSFTNCIPTRGTSVSDEVAWEGRDASKKLHFWCVNTDFDYNKAVRVDMIAGRYFDKSHIADSACFVINDIAASVMNYKDPVGRSLTLRGRKGTIIGVFKGFHAVDLAGPYAPTIISLDPGDRGTVLVRFSSGSFSEKAEKIGKIFRTYEAGIPYQPVLFSDLPDFSKLRTTSGLVGLAFLIAIALASLGLSGLAAFTVEKRTREIGIRKASGATTSLITLMFLKGYAKWIGIATLIALPVSFTLGRLFLSRFYFRAPMPVWTFIAGPVIALVIALLTVAIQTRRAAARNPVEALSFE